MRQSPKACYVFNTLIRSQCGIPSASGAKNLARLPPDLVAVYIALELFDHELLFTYDGFHEVADRNDSNHGIVVEDGEVPNCLCGHHRHALIHGLVRCHTKHTL